MQRASQGERLALSRKEAVESYFARHRVKPGITGWAQINGWRGETDTIEKIQRRVEHDLYYIENWSLCFSTFYILIRTPVCPCQHGPGLLSAVDYSSAHQTLFRATRSQHAARYAYSALHCGC